MSLKITYIGHAGFILQTNEVKMLCDPWFYGALHGSWYPHPYNRHMIDIIERQNPTHIYISHGHEDHCDIKYLNSVNKNIRFVVPYFYDLEMQKRLKNFDNVLYLKNEEELIIKDLSIKMYLDVMSGKNDSAALFNYKGYKILNLNDCYLDPDCIPKCDMLWGQFSGAIHYPHAYDFDEVAQKDKVEEFRTRTYKEVLQKAKKSECSVFIPSAGPPCFLDESQEHFNDKDKTIFYDWNFFDTNFSVDASEIRVLEAQPGNSYVLENKSWLLYEANNVSKTLEEYREETKQERSEDYNSESVSKQDLESYFNKVRMNHLHLLKLQHKSFILKLKNKKYIINLSSMPQTVYDENEECPEWFSLNYTMDIPTNLMKEILNGNAWDVALASGRIKLHRDEDVYDTVLFKILYADFFSEKTKQLAKILAGDVEMIERNGLCYQRYCPHAGADLKNANIDGGIIECPRHNWKWDINTGECIKGGSIKLKCK